MSDWAERKRMILISLLSLSRQQSLPNHQDVSAGGCRIAAGRWRFLGDPPADDGRTLHEATSGHQGGRLPAMALHGSSNPPKPTGERQPSAMQWKWRSLLLLDLLPRPTQAITRDSSGRNHLPCLPCAQQCYFQHNERITDRKVGKYKSVLCICTVGEMYAYVGFLVLTAPQFISILTGLVKVTAACCINDTICGE